MFTRVHRICRSSGEGEVVEILEGAGLRRAKVRSAAGAIVKWPPSAVARLISAIASPSRASRLFMAPEPSRPGLPSTIPAGCHGRDGRQRRSSALVTIMGRLSDPSTTSSASPSSSRPDRRVPCDALVVRALRLRRVRRLSCQALLTTGDGRSPMPVRRPASSATAMSSRRARAASTARLGCEACHGPLGRACPRRTDEAADGPAHAACVRRVSPPGQGKPKGFPQVVVQEHASAGPCTDVSPGPQARPDVGARHEPGPPIVPRATPGRWLLLTGAAALAWEHVVAGEPEAAPNYTLTDHWWGMIIDIDKCIGCGNCVRACKAENDVPLEPTALPHVGRALRGRPRRPRSSARGFAQRRLRRVPRD